MNHEKLICYQKLIDVLREVFAVQKMLPRGYCYLSDQLNRALTSSILNLSEGNARRSKKERKRFFEISLASIAESLSCIDILYATNLISKIQFTSIKDSLKLSYRMIYKL